jgi:hypothetical protein
MVYIVGCEGGDDCSPASTTSTGMASRIMVYHRHKITMLRGERPKANEDAFSRRK